MAGKPKNPPKEGPGRPSLYKPEYCDLLIEHMSKGYSYESFAGIVDVCKDTLYEWQGVHAEFSDAKKKAFAKCQIFWEKMGIENLLCISERSQEGRDSYSKTTSLNTGVWVFNMKNRFNWSDKVEIKDKEKEKPQRMLAYDRKRK